MRRQHLLALAFVLVACSSGPTKGPGGSPGAGGNTPGAGGSTPGTGGSTPGAGGSTPGTGGSTPGTGGSGGAPGGSGGGSGTGGGAGRDAAPPTDPGRDSSADLEPDKPPPPCNYPDWKAGTMYKAGDIVMYMGKAYRAKADNPGYDPLISTFFWEPYAGCIPPPPKPAALCPDLDKLLPDGEKTFLAMFTPTYQGWVPLAAYSYSSLCKAIAAPKLAGFARSGNATQDKRELAAFFANVAIETAYLQFIDENGHSAGEQNFHGRGSLQITGQPIYSEAGAFLGLNLVGMPQLASGESVVWQTGMWYWMEHANPSVGGAQICHQAIVGSDFGQTIRIIKGDCGSAGLRVAQYRKNCTMLGVDPGRTECP